MDNEFEFQFFDLDSIFESNPILESKLDLSHIFESILVPVPFTLEPKLTTPPSHVPFFDQGIDHYDSEMIFQDWSYNRDSFNVTVLHDPIHLGVDKNVHRKEVTKGGFLNDLRDLDWVVTLGPIRSLPEPPP